MKNDPEHQINVPAGWKLVPLEMTREMHQACKGAIYRHVVALPRDARAKAKGLDGGYRVDSRTKRIVRWQATLEAAPEFSERSEAHEPPRRIAVAVLKATDGPSTGIGK